MVSAVALLPFVAIAVASAAESSPSSSVYWGNVTGSKGDVYPTAVGFLGETKYGAPPFLAQVDKLNTTRPNGKYGVEMRWLPKDSDEDSSSPDEIFRNLGQVSPFHSADDLFNSTNKYANVPDQCKIKQVHILHRHGARYPTGGTSGGEYKFGEKVRNATKAGKLEAKGDLAFLKHWNYTLGTEVLTHVGAQELFDSGVKHYYAYAALLENLTDHKPVLRTTSQSRMIDSARYWTLGFFGWDAPKKMNLEVITEDKTQNNTLNPICEGSNTTKQAKRWEKEYAPKIAERLNKMVSGMKIETEDIYFMQTLCGYETVSLGYSNFCNIFTKEEWEQHEYAVDLEFMTGSGLMNPVSKAMGVGYVMEFLDRVTKKKFHGPQALQNSTLDKQEAYYPLDQRLYADFTHDTTITSIITAFNLTQVVQVLNPTKPDPKRTYRASRVTPFGARLVFEVLDCDGDNDSNQYIRAKINDAVIPLNENQGCEKRDDGLCKLHDFIQYLKKHAYKSSHFDVACFGKNGTDYVIGDYVTNGSLKSSQIKH
ncbi:hypothetical protein MOBT1_000246 [Malassezia obtusa]|uniref:Acid phosphatase n=1 Tax=Malassezia obtusa TaxID=76774 RepID=A0AAF0DWR5_9BASI|nr:hypothetical protein MOBT1_000246 [Malassezia obtusa]